MFFKYELFCVNTFACFFFFFLISTTKMQNKAWYKCYHKEVKCLWNLFLFEFVT